MFRKTFIHKTYKGRKGIFFQTANTVSNKNFSLSNQKKTKTSKSLIESFLDVIDHADSEFRHFKRSFLISGNARNIYRVK